MTGQERRQAVPTMDGENRPLARRSPRVDGVTLAARCAVGLAAQLEWLLGAVAAFAGQGHGLAAGVRVQVGRSLITLQPDGSELLCEPDRAGDPLGGPVPDVTRTLLVLAQQKDVLARVAVAEAEFALLYQRVVTAHGCLATPRVDVRHGEPTSPDDSGWSIGTVEGENAGCEDMAVREVLRARPRLLDVMALPRGYRAVRRGPHHRRGQQARRRAVAGRGTMRSAKNVSPLLATRREKGART